MNIHEQIQTIKDEADYLLRQEEFEEALTRAEQGIALAHEHNIRKGVPMQSLYAHRGTALSMLGRHDEAVAALLTSLQMAPEWGLYGYGAYNLVCTHVRAGDHGPALEMLEQLVRAEVGDNAANSSVPGIAPYRVRARTDEDLRPLHADPRFWDLCFHTDSADVRELYFALRDHKAVDVDAVLVKVGASIPCSSIIWTSCLSRGQLDISAWFEHPRIESIRTESLWHLIAAMLRPGEEVASCDSIHVAVVRELMRRDGDAAQRRVRELVDRKRAADEDESIAEEIASLLESEGRA